jgi:hypothetical protein
MATSPSQNSSGCPRRIGRRCFLAAAGASALAAKTAPWLDFVSPLFADELSPPGVPRVRVAFVRPDEDRYWMAWPGASYDVAARQTEYTKQLTEAAKRFGVELDVSPLPLHEPEGVNRFLEQLSKSPPDGLVLTVMHLKSWPQVQYIAKNRGDFPTIVFSPLGTSLVEQPDEVAQVPRTFVAATPESHWLSSGMRMLKTIWELKHARIALVSDVATGDRRVEPLGTTLHYVPLDRWFEELEKTEVNDEVREIAKHYAIESRAIVEPEAPDLFNAARNYLVARAIMAAQKCQAISLDCARMVGQRRIPCGTCLAWSKLLDEGQVAACEADENAAVTMLLVSRLFDRPGFMYDPVADTVSNTLIGSHCTCATRLDGYDQPAASFVLRSHAESGTGVALQVAWRPDQEVTIAQFQNPGRMCIGTGKVVRNLDSTRTGGCRTSVEFALDDVVNSCDVKGHHQVVVYGKLDRPLRAFCQLAGIRVGYI